jgi:hypothetical protein
MPACRPRSSARCGADSLRPKGAILGEIGSRVGPTSSAGRTTARGRLTRPCADDETLSAPGEN